MGYLIQRSTINTDVKQRILGTPVSSQKTTVANTALDILDTDTTATLNRRVIITNSLASTLFLALGRTATATNYDIPINSGDTWVEDVTSDKISAISTSAGTNLVTITVSNYVEV